MRSEMEQRADAILDPLTGLLNRKALQTRFAELASQAALTDGWISVIECDLDRFKQVNDLHGHDRGDAVLKDAAYCCASTCARSSSSTGSAARSSSSSCPAYRGRAADLAERVRDGIEVARPGGLPVTASFGVAGALGDEVEFEALFREADAALYSAKDRGRNRVETVGDEPAPATLPPAGDPEPRCAARAALDSPPPGA